MYLPLLSPRRAGKLCSCPFQPKNGANGCNGFTLIEILFVVAVIVGIMSMIAPAIDAMTQHRGVESAAYGIAGALETARTYAIANNTYTWVGFFEEDASAHSTTPAKPGIGNLVVSIVASKNGTLPYDPNDLSAMNSESLIQLGKLLKIGGVHLATFDNNAEESSNFANRPPASNDAARIGNTTAPASSQTPFHYPLSDGPVRYTFTKAVQFSPRGEARVNNSSIKPVAEFGLASARGNALSESASNKAAVQLTGIAGNVTIYRP